MIIGCDEAGRGPVLGSMFVTAIRGKIDMIPDIVDDSKNIKNEKVVKIYENIKDTDLEFKSIEIKNNKIDKMNINNISKSSYSKCINDISKKCDTVFIDCFSNNKSEISEFMNENLDVNRVNIEFKADEKYKIVAASSIVSKAKRENHMEQLSNNYNYDIGSGYPSDQKTREFLKNYVIENNEAPECARLSWKTTVDILEKYDE